MDINNIINGENFFNKTYEDLNRYAVGEIAYRLVYFTIKKRLFQVFIFCKTSFKRNKFETCYILIV
ncbi:hypothetical protein C6B38_01840 [Spiroplasma sp. ChiS]|uniref:hypothetical protein n=1 Tax=Spiroplasma sp. ChiS TaxID=2099885 RepID=UPI000CFA1C27|nr:hypothetical protein [Spiroplasma sp. ChiS]PQP79266.1 hypothetical protein C6B38_01840 [Spiroplasma sp. ChiS]